MDTLNHFREFFDYDHWANREALASLASLEPGKSECPLQLLGHVIGAERLWLQRFDTAAPSALPWPAITGDEAGPAIDEIYAQWRVTLDRMEREGLDRDLSYRNTKGVEFKTPIRDVLTHLVMHSAYHRGQLAAAVRAAGGKPAATDYVAWVRKGKKP